MVLIFRVSLFNKLAICVKLMLTNIYHFIIAGMAPGDDIFVRLDPGENFTYQYTFGEDHMPGTHWYHP